MSLHRRYEPARTCTSGPAAGAKALMAWFLGAHAAQGGRNLGIYNCRSVRGGSTTSLHGEGRACDFGINPHGAAWGDVLAERLRLASGEIGIQCLIWDRRIWSGAYPDAGWRHYSGAADHRDHIHVELSRAAASNLTPEQVHRALTPAERPTTTAPKAPRNQEDDAVFVKSQLHLPDQRVSTALLSGPMFIGLNADETHSADGEIRKGATVLWVEPHTWRDMDARSKWVCGITEDPQPPRQ